MLIFLDLGLGSEGVIWENKISVDVGYSRLPFETLPSLRELSINWGSIRWVSHNCYPPYRYLKSVQKCWHEPVVPSYWCLLKFIFKNKMKFSVAGPSEEWSCWRIIVSGSLEAVGIVYRSRDRTWRTSLIHRSPGVRDTSTTCNTHIGRKASYFLQPEMLVRVCHPLLSAEGLDFTTLSSRW